MTILVPTVGEVKLLEFALGFSAPGNQLLKLYTSNTTPADGDTAATYTEMGAVQAYAYKTLAKASWSIATSSSVGTATYAAQTWTFDGTGGSATVYGYFVTDATSGVLLWAERFSASKTAANNGDVIIITPVITLSKV